MGGRCGGKKRFIYIYEETEGSHGVTEVKSTQEMNEEREEGIEGRGRARERERERGG